MPSRLSKGCADGLFELDRCDAAGGTRAEDGDDAGHHTGFVERSGDSVRNIVRVAVALCLQCKLACDDHAMHSLIPASIASDRRGAAVAGQDTMPGD